MLKGEFEADLYNMTINLKIQKSGLSNNRPRTLDSEDL